nr:MAG TPA: hypothetical protein [Crassvirales sp.]
MKSSSIGGIFQIVWVIYHLINSSLDILSVYS